MLTYIFVWFAGVIFSTYIAANVFMGASVPLFFELACEVTYPVAEGVTNLVLTLVNNIAGLIFLLIPLIPNIGMLDYIILMYVLL